MAAGAGTGDNGRQVRGGEPTKGEPSWLCTEAAGQAEVGQGLLRQVQQVLWGPSALFGHPHQPVQNSNNMVSKWSDNMDMKNRVKLACTSQQLEVVSFPTICNYPMAFLKICTFIVLTEQNFGSSLIYVLYTRNLQAQVRSAEEQLFHSRKGSELLSQNTCPILPADFHKSLHSLDLISSSAK